MTMYGVGQSIGINIGQYIAAKIRPFLPKWVRVLLAIVLLGGLLFLMGVALNIVLQQNHYKRLQRLADTIFQAQQVYYAEYGQYTANMEKLGLSLPNIVQEEYQKGSYQDENGEILEGSERYIAQTQEGDNLSVQVMGGETAPGAVKLPAVVEISVASKFGKLPASYSIRHYFGEDAPSPSTFFQCDVMILHGEKESLAQRDVHKGGRFCSRLGAQPSNVPLIWLFDR